MISCFSSRMSGVNIDQWRGSIGRFNIQKNPQVSQIKHQQLLICTILLGYLRLFRGHFVFVLSLIHSFLIIFGLSCMATILFPLVFLFQMGFGHLLRPGSVSFCRDISHTFYLVFSFPKSTLLLIREPRTEGLPQRPARGDYKLQRRRGRRRHRSGADVIKWRGPGPDVYIHALRLPQS